MIIVKTEAGLRVLKDRSVPLTPRQRSAFILVDGKRTLDQLLAATALAGVTREDFERLFEAGLVADANPQETASRLAAVQAAAEEVHRHKTRTPWQRYAEAYPLAVRLAAGLGVLGAQLNLDVEAVASFEELQALAPRLLAAVGPGAFAALDFALNDR